MTDTNPTRRRHDADTTTARDVVSPTVAAQRLGITPDAVRARLRRGTIAGELVDGDWHVFLPRETDDTTADTTRHDDQHDKDPARHDTDTMPTVGRHDADTMPPPLDRTQELIDSLRGEVAFLRDQLDKRSRELADERERSDVLHREAFARIEALTSATNVAKDEDDIFTESVKNSSDDLCGNFPHKSTESPQSDDVAPGREPVESMTAESLNEAPKAARSGWGGLWDWLRGK